MSERTLDYIFRAVGAAETRDQINSVGDSLRKNSELADTSSSRFSRMNSTLLSGAKSLAIGIGAFGAAYGLKDIAEAGMNMQALQNRLEAVSKSAGLTNSQFQELDASAVKMAEHGGASADAERQGLIQLVGATHNATKAMQANKAAVDLSLGTSTSYTAAVSAIANAEAGRATRLQKMVGYIAPVKTAEQNLTNAYQQQAAVIQGSFGTTAQKQMELVQLQETSYSKAAQAAATHADAVATATKYLAAIQQKYGSQTTAYANTTAGRISDLKNTFAEDMGDIGKAIDPAIGAVAGFAAHLLAMKPVMYGVAAVVGVLAAAWGAKGLVGAIKLAFSPIFSAKNAITGLADAQMQASKMIQANSAMTRENSLLQKQASLYYVDESGKLTTFRGDVEGATAQTKLASGELMTYNNALQTAGERLQATNARLTTAAEGLKAQQVELDAAAASTDVLSADTEALTIAQRVQAAGSAVYSAGMGLATTATEAFSVALDMIPGVAVMMAIGLAATELMEHWKAVMNVIVNVAKSVFDFIKSHWKTAIEVVLGPLGFVIAHLKEIYGWIKDIGHIFSSVFGGVAHAIGSIAGGIGGFVGSIFNEGGVVTQKPMPITNAGQVKAKYLAEGGPIGTDTVPTWLTPGEGVLSRQAMSMVGTAGLGQLNAGIMPGGAQNITITPGVVNVQLDTATIARAIVQYTLNKAARGPSSLVGGALTTGVTGTGTSSGAAAAFGGVSASVGIA